MFASIWSRHRFAASLGAAATVHGLLLLAPDDRRVVRVEEFVELDLLTEPAEARQQPHLLPTPSAGSLGARDGASSPLSLERVQPSKALGAVDGTDPSVTDALLTEVQPEDAELRGEEGSQKPTPGTNKQKPVRLFLGPRQLGQLVQLPQHPARAVPETPSVEQRLAEALAPVDGGSASRASPVVSAGYRSAQLAPADGTTIIEVRADRHGQVTAVHVVGVASANAWSAVAAELRRTLKGKSLQMRKGALGMVIRLRVDRGKFTRTPNKIPTLEPGVAIGQESPSFAFDEASQGLKDRGGSVPALGVSSDWLRTTVATKIQLLSIIFL